MINTYAWARVLDDNEPIAAMSDAEFAEFWAALGRAVRIASRASGGPDPAPVVTDMTAVPG